MLQEKHPDISLFYTCVPKFLIWYTVLDIECDRLKLAIMGHYLPFYTPSSKPKKSKEKKQLLEISSFYTSVPKTTLIWGMLLETQWDRQTILLFRAIFCPFNPLKTRKIKILKKSEIHLEMSSFYICVPKIMIWCMLPEIWSITDIIFYHFRSIFVVSAPENPGNQNFKKIKKKKKKKKKPPRDIIILHKCTKNQDHMLYCSWDMVHDGCNYFSFWTIFCPFISPASHL